MNANIQKTVRKKLEMENTEFDYGHNVNYTSIGKAGKIVLVIPFSTLKR